MRTLPPEADLAFPDRVGFKGPMFCVACRAEVPASQVIWTQGGQQAHVLPEFPYRQHDLGRMQTALA